MDCAGIQELLSEYIDGTLDAQTVQMVEKHIFACEDCKNTLDSLRTMVEELNTLEPIKAPADFLEKIHERMESRSIFSRFFRKLFVPFKIKIPLQLAAAATASILVVMVLNIQKSEYQKMQPLKAPKSQGVAEKSKEDHLTSEFNMKTETSVPAFEEAPGRLSDSEQGMPAQRSRAKTPGQPSIQMDAEPSSSVMAKAKPSAVKGRSTELLVELKPAVFGRGYAPDMAMPTTPLAEGDKKTIEKEKTDKELLDEQIEDGRKSRSNDLLLRMNHTIWSLKGDILTKEFHKEKDRLKSIHAQIPARNYASFCRELNRLATFKVPPPVLPDENLEMVHLLIIFNYPE